MHDAFTSATTSLPYRMGYPHRDTPAACHAAGDGNFTIAGRTITYTTTDHRIPPGGLLPPSALRKTLDGQWLYLHGDSSTRGLFIGLLQNLASMAGGTTMNASHWLGSNLDLKEISWADVILRAEDGSRLGARSGACPNAVQRQCIMPFFDGGIDPKQHATTREHLALARLWCTGASGCGRHSNRSVETGYMSQRCRMASSRSSGSESSDSDGSGGSSWWPLTVVNNMLECPRARPCRSPKGMIRLTFRFAAYAGTLPRDPFLELRTRLLVEPCLAVAGSTASAEAISAEASANEDVSDHSGNAAESRPRTRKRDPKRAGAHGSGAAGDAAVDGSDGEAPTVMRTPWLTRAPDLHLLQTGSWDNALGTVWSQFETHLQLGLEAWREAAAFAPPTKLAFSGAPVDLVLPLGKDGNASIVERPARAEMVTLQLRAEMAAARPLTPRARMAAAQEADRQAMAEAAASPSGAVRPGTVDEVCITRTRSHSGPRVHYWDGSYEAALFGRRRDATRDDEWARLTRGVFLLNRAASAARLEAGLGPRVVYVRNETTGELTDKRQIGKQGCPCLNARYRESLGSSMLYHPPPLNNLWDSQQLVAAAFLSVERSGGRRKATAAAATSPVDSTFDTASAVMYTFELDQELNDWCCCPPPAPAANESGVGSLGTRLWLRVCRLRDS